jgi:hypothetical protein
MTSLQGLVARGFTHEHGVDYYETFRNNCKGCYAPGHYTYGIIL